MKSLFSYTTYREYLHDYYVERKALDGFTYRAFAQMMGMNSSSWLLLLINGEKNLTVDSAVRISQALGHQTYETEFFISLVNFTQAKTIESRNHFFGEILAIKKRLSSRKKLGITMLAENQYEYYAHWYHPVVRSLVSKIDFQDDYALLAEQLIPVITARQAKKSVKLLERIELLRRNAKGSWEQCEALLSTGDEVDSLSVINYHKQTAQMAAEAFDSCAKDERDISGITMGISAQDFNVIKTAIQLFRKDMMKIAQDSTNEDCVYQLNVQLFPMARIRKGGE